MPAIGRLDGVSGRKRGSRNKKSLTIQEKALQLGINPLEVVLHFAAGHHSYLDLPPISSEMRLKAALELLPYFYPKHAQIQVNTTVQNPLRDPCQELSDEELREDD